MRPSIARTTTGALLLVALSACGTQAATQSAPTPAASSPSAASSTPAPTSASPTASSSSPAAPTRGSYIDYAAYAADPSMYSAGKVVLFFHAGWCPKCQETDKNLSGDPASLPAGLTVVKADFDSETDLRQKYGVGVQHTFVQVDVDGQQLAKWTGTYTGDDIAGKTV
jgi:thiol-disulfide isomerase/thioredoxin